MDKRRSNSAWIVGVLNDLEEFCRGNGLKLTGIAVRRAKSLAVIEQSISDDKLSAGQPTERK